MALCALSLRDVHSETTFFQVDIAQGVTELLNQNIFSCDRIFLKEILQEIIKTCLN